MDLSTTGPRKILILDDDEAIHLTNKYILKDKYDVRSCYTAQEAFSLLQKESVDLILLDLNISHESEGIEILPHLKELSPESEVLILSASVDVELAKKSALAGASGYLLKDSPTEQILLMIENFLSRKTLIHENTHFAKSRLRTVKKEKILGISSYVTKLLADIQKISKSKANVIIFGETGTGKELVAKHISCQEENTKPFVSVDSATITNSMAESLLFGHEKGSFTGATHTTVGLFEEANGGTIYFDEIGNMPLEIQTKLLRVLQEKEVSRVGSSKKIPLDFRVICATNQNLEDLCKKGLFKFDLLQRLQVLEINLRPLRERSEDIVSLVEYFSTVHSVHKKPLKFSDEAMELLKRYRWPGNIRELSNLIAYLCTMAFDKDQIDKEDLPTRILDQFSQITDSPKHTLSNDYYAELAHAEKDLLKSYYDKFNGNISSMSKALKISRTQLYTKLQDFSIRPKQ
ncbi:MAG: sigma-54-dependent transcriptional regulator [Bacteriovoracia bacterium]